MTTVAWDGKTLAADRWMTSNGSVTGKTSKIAKRKDGELIGVAGEINTAMRYMRWFMAGEPEPRPSLKADVSPETAAAALIIRKNGGVEWHDRDGWSPMKGKSAIGSGDACALVAMHMGASAAKAIKVVSNYDIYTGPDVDVVSLDVPKKKKAKRKHAPSNT